MSNVLDMHDGPEHLRPVDIQAATLALAGAPV